MKHKLKFIGVIAIPIILQACGVAVYDESSDRGRSKNAHYDTAQYEIYFLDENDESSQIDSGCIDIDRSDEGTISVYEEVGHSGYDYDLKWAVRQDDIVLKFRQGFDTLQSSSYQKDFVERGNQIELRASTESDSTYIFTLTGENCFSN